MQLCAAHDQNSVTGDELSADEKGGERGKWWTASGRTTGRKSEGCGGQGLMSGKWGRQIKYK